MPIVNLKIESILDGHSATQYFGSSASYNSSIAIDPDFPIGSNTKASGMAVPTVYEKFSGTEVTGYPMWIISQVKTSNCFVYTTDGKVHSFDSNLAMRATDEAGTALPIQITSGAGNGGAYYNNFAYFAKPTNISQIGPLSGGTVAKTEDVWTGAKFSKTALTNTTYPTVRGVSIPNHPMHVHSDNCNYIGDVVNGQGVIHRMKTKKVTVEGDTDDTTVPSAFNALDLPFGFYPTDQESYGNDLVIAAIQTSDSTINQGRAELFFWETTNTDSYYRRVPLPDPLVTALLNVNGMILVWSGNAQSGVRLSRYIGGDTVSELAYIEDGFPPFAGAVDAIGSRVTWGSYTTYPISTASVLAYGSKRESLPKGIHNIARSTSANSSNQLVTAVKYVQQASNIKPRVIIGWGDASAKGLDKLSTTGTCASVLRWHFNVGKKFVLNQIRIPLGGAVDANTSITTKIYLDDESSSQTLNEINNTNYPGRRRILYKPSELQSCTGYNDFIFELTWAGTTQMPVKLPILIDVDVTEEEEQ